MSAGLPKFEGYDEIENNETEGSGAEEESSESDGDENFFAYTIKDAEMKVEENKDKQAVEMKRSDERGIVTREHELKQRYDPTGQRGIYLYEVTVGAEFMDRRDDRLARFELEEESRRSDRLRYANYIPYELLEKLNRGVPIQILSSSPLEGLPQRDHTSYALMDVKQLPFDYSNPDQWEVGVDFEDMNSHLSAFAEQHRKQFEKHVMESSYMDVYALKDYKMYRHERVTFLDDLPLRPEVLHVFGTDDMLTSEVKDVFSKHGIDPKYVEWINDSSCNVVYANYYSATSARARIAPPSISSCWSALRVKLYPMEDFLSRREEENMQVDAEDGTFAAVDGGRRRMKPQFNVLYIRMATVLDTKTKGHKFNLESRWVKKAKRRRANMMARDGMSDDTLRTDDNETAPRVSGGRQ